MKILQYLLVFVLGIASTGIFAQEDHLYFGEREHLVRIFGMPPEAEGIARRAQEAV